MSIRYIIPRTGQIPLQFSGTRLAQSADPMEHAFRVVVYLTVSGEYIIHWQYGHQCPDAAPRSVVAMVPALDMVYGCLEMFEFLAWDATHQAVQAVTTRYAEAVGDIVTQLMRFLTPGQLHSGGDASLDIAINRELDRLGCSSLVAPRDQTCLDCFATDADAIVSLHDDTELVRYFYGPRLLETLRGLAPGGTRQALWMAITPCMVQEDI